MNQKRVHMELSQKLQDISKEIQSLETQLAMVESKLSGLKKDVLIYVGSIIGPMLVIGALSFLSAHSHGLMNAIFQAVGSALSLINFFVQPIIFYHLLKSLFMWYYNREREGYVYGMPKEREQYPKPEKIVPEENYVAERHKVWMVLNKYYLYREELEKKLEECSGKEEVAEQEIYSYLNHFVLYEQIRTMDPFTGPVARKAKRNARRVFIALIVIAAIVIINSLSKSFGRRW